jgi:hypothetical protein
MPVKQLLVPALFLFGAGAFAANPVIGIVAASGHFTLQGSEVWGNATLFDGATVETGAASSQLALRNGVKVQLGARSRARVYADRVTLEKGVGQISPASYFELDAAGMKIQGAGLRVNVSDQVEIAALTGMARVSSSQGTALAVIPAGRHMNLSFQAAQSGTLTRSGCLLYKEAHFILQDENTMEVVELAGQDLAPNLGNRVQVRGTASSARPAVTIATSVLTVTGVSPQSTGGCLVVASTLNAQTEVPRGVTPQSGQTASGNTAPAGQTPKATGGGLSTGAKAAIIIGVAGGAGAGAAVALSSKKSSTSP